MRVNVDLRNHTGDARHSFFDRRRRARNRLFDRRRQLVLQQLIERRLVLRLQRFERHLVFREKAERSRVNERRGRTLIHQRHRHVEVLVDALQLSEVCEFVWSRDVTDRREQRVLHQRPQQHIGAEMMRFVPRFLDQRGRGRLPVADDGTAIRDPDWLALIVQIEERDSAAMGRDL
jgi:hypothetical protein